MTKKISSIIYIFIAAVCILFAGCDIFGEGTSVLTYYTPTPKPENIQQQTETPLEQNMRERYFVDIPVNSLNALIDENIPEETSQVVLVTVTEDGEQLYCLESMDKAWKVVLGPFDCNIGRNGLGKLKEGDGKSPAGVYPIGTAFGQGGPPEGSAWPWRETDKDDYWVEDPNSIYYNQYANINDVEKDWNAAENLFIDPYKMAIEVEYNPENEKRLGSAIFMHIWLGEDVATGGCTSMSADSISQVLKWLRPEARPVLFQTEYISQLPNGFCYIIDYTPEIAFDIRFYSSENFMGRQALEYLSPIGIASIEMTRILDKASLLLKQQGLTLLVYDSYRPQTTVNEIVDWLNDETDIKAKSTYYPNMDKSEMIDMYFEAKSPYPRGAAVDVSILDAYGNELDMGTPFQYIDETSSFYYKDLTDKQYNNRELLRDVMIQVGLNPNDTFWWSFYLEDEPYPEQSFDFYIQ